MRRDSHNRTSNNARSKESTGACPAASRVTVETRAASGQSLALRRGAVQSAPDVLRPQQETPQEQARQAQKAMGVGHANALAEKGGATSAALFLSAS